MNKLCEAIKKTRQKKNITQKKLAKISGCSQSLLSKIENGYLPSSKIFQILHVLKIQILGETHDIAIHNESESSKIERTTL